MNAAEISLRRLVELRIQIHLTHFLLYKYGVDWHALVNASQGDNAKEIAKAQAMLEEVQAAFRESDAKHKQQFSEARNQ